MFIVASTNKEIVEKVDNELIISQEFLNSLPKEGILLNLFGNSGIRSFKHTVSRNTTEIVIKFLDKGIDNSFESLYVNRSNLQVLHDIEKYANIADKLLTDDFKDNYPKEIDPYIYVIYGSGPNKSGPHICTVKTFNISANRGAVEYTLVLVPAGRDLEGEIFQTIQNSISTAPSKLYFEGSTDPIDISKPVPYGLDKYSKINQSEYGPVSPSQGQIIDYHLLLKDLIKSYVRNITGTNNVLVLLPDINVICGDKLYQFYENTTYSTRSQDPEPSFALFKYLRAEDDKTTYNFVDKYLRVVNAVEAFVKAFTRVRLPLIEIEKDLQKSLNIDLLDPDFNNIFFKDQTQFRTFEEYVKYHIDKYILKLKIKRDRIDGPTTLLLDLFNVIVQLSKNEDSYRFNIYTETNSKLVNVVKQDDLMLTDLLVEDAYDIGNLQNAGSELVIVGEETLINKYLYGLDSLLDPTQQESDQKLLDFPLHPLDFAVFGNSKFQEKLVNTISKRENFFPIFVDEKNTTEGIGLNPYKGEIGIIDYTINDKNTFRGKLENINVEKANNTIKIVGLAPKVVADYLDPDSSIDRIDLEEYIRSLYNVLNTNKDTLDNFFKSLVGSISLSNTTSTEGLDPKEQAEQLISSILADLEKEKIERGKTLGPNLVYDDSLFTDQGKLKSLISTKNKESFKLSLSLNTRFCPQYGSYYLIGKIAKVKISPGRFRLQIPEYYTIIGYSHTMTDKSLVSQFELLTR